MGYSISNNGESSLRQQPAAAKQPRFSVSSPTVESRTVTEKIIRNYGAAFVAAHLSVSRQAVMSWIEDGGNRDIFIRLHGFLNELSSQAGPGKKQAMYILRILCSAIGCIPVTAPPRKQGVAGFLLSLMGPVASSHNVHAMLAQHSTNGTLTAEQLRAMRDEWDNVVESALHGREQINYLLTQAEESENREIDLATPYKKASPYKKERDCYTVGRF